MMRYGAGASYSGINTAGRAYAALMAGASKRLRVFRITHCMTVACSTVPLFLVARVTAAGVTPGATTTPQAFDGNDVAAAATLLTGGFGTQPTVSSASPHDVASFPLTAGIGWVWNFSDEPLVVPVGVANGLCVYNSNASGATLGTFVTSFLYAE